MARHAQPLLHAEIKGQTKKHPGRYKGIPEVDLPLGDAPDYMEDDAKECWRELSACALKGVITGADSQVLELTANLLAEYRRDVVSFQVGKYTHLIGGLARLGMSPSDRQKLRIDKADDDNPYTRLKPVA